MTGCYGECCFGVIYAEWHGVCNFCDFCLGVNVDYGVVYVFQVCFHLGVVYGIVICVYVGGVVECCLFHESGFCLL